MTKKRPPLFRSPAGFSLAELLVALALCALLAAFALPGIARMERAWTLWESAKGVEASLHWGRMHAISANQGIQFDVSPGGESYGWSDPESGHPYATSLRNLPRGIRITSFPVRPLRFHPRGNAAPGGSFAVGADGGAYRVVVSPGGRIRFE